MHYWISRVAILTNRGQMNDDPVLFAVRDRNSQICAAAIFALAVAAAIGLAVFGETLTPATLAGAAIVVGAGLFTIWRTRQVEDGR